MNADTIREFVEDIGREGRLSRITEDLLRLTRLDSGVQDAAYPVSVSRVLERGGPYGDSGPGKGGHADLRANEDAVVGPRRTTSTRSSITS